MASEYIGVDGVARKVPTHYIGVDGVARNVKSGYVGVDGVARLFFAPEDGSPVILEVEKVVSNTYANSTTYENEEFILLDIYPKTGGTVNVTYGGLTKTITDTSGAEEPNAQQVFFGTFNGVSDSVVTPTSGTLTIDGDCYAFACGPYADSEKNLLSPSCPCVTEIKSFGNTSAIPNKAFGNALSASPITKATIPASIKSIGDEAFYYCPLESVIISNGVESIGGRAFTETKLIDVVIPASVNNIGNNPFQIKGNNILTVDSGNRFYKVDGNCLIEIATNKLVSGFADSVFPSYVTEIGANAFTAQTAYTSMTIPAQITKIGDGGLWIHGLQKVIMLATTPPVIDGGIFISTDDYVLEIVVPKGCLNVYKTAEGWQKYATNTSQFIMTEAT